MGVQVDQPGGDNLTGHRNGPLGLGRIDVTGDRRNPAACEGHVGRRIEGLGRVDDPSSLEKELILSSLGLTKRARAGHQHRYRTHAEGAYHLSSVHALASLSGSETIRPDACSRTTSILTTGPAFVATPDRM